MATPPRVTHAEAEQAAARIWQRHQQAGARYLDEMGIHPRQVLAHLRRHADAWPSLLVQDLDDAAILHVYLWWEAADRERWLYEAVARHGDRLKKAGARRRGRRRPRDEGIESYEQLVLRFGARFGLASYQGFVDRLGRLRQLLRLGGSGRPDEQAERSDRAGAAHNAALTAWLAEPAHRAVVVEFAGALLELAEFADEDAAEELVHVRSFMREEQWTAGSLVTLGYAVAALDGSPGIRGGVPAWPRVLERWEQLYGQARASLETG